MENQDKLYEQFKEAAGKAEQKDFARMEAVWNRVEEKLDNKKQRRIAAWWKYTGMAAVFLLFMGVGFFMLTNEKNNPVIAPTVTPENNVTTIDTQKVKETFDPSKAVEKEAVVSNEEVKTFYKEGGKTTSSKAIVEGYSTTTKPMTIEDAAKVATPLYGSDYKITGDTIFYTNGAKGIVTANNKLRIWESRTDIGEFRIKGEITERDDKALAKSYATASPSGDVVYKETQRAKSKDKVQAIEPTALVTVQPAANPVAATARPIVAEPKMVSGIITDSSGMPVPGVNVVVQGTNRGTQTDFDGNFMIDAKEGEKIIASYVGMQTQTVTLGKVKNISFKLQDDATELDAVVVQGYTSSGSYDSAYRSDAQREANQRERQAAKEAKKAAKEPKSFTEKAKMAQASAVRTPVTASPSPAVTTTPSTRTYRDGDRQSNNTIATVASKTIESRPNADFIQTLQGQVPGLNISTGAGQPGANSTVILRGYGSINGNVEPLYVIDGVPMNSDNFRQINPNDIESVSVLKDAGATSIYGNRGANGVIIVKTKKPLTEKEKRKLEKLNKKLEKQKEKHPENVTTSEVPKQALIEVDHEEYESFEENQFENPATTPLSTFSIDVDNASYTNIRRFLNNGQTVPKDAVRVEEMINFFKYQYPQPANNEPFSINTEYSDAPWNPQHKLLKIGLQGKIIPDESLPASNFVFLIDVSGSMDNPNKLPLLKQSMKLLASQMRKKDRIAIVVYAGAAGMVLPSTNGDEKEKIYAALDNLNAGGSTAGGAGIQLAYKTAEDNFVKNGNNRVILATDGDFNVGASSDSDMQTLIEDKRKSGVFLTCLGYGMGNYKDSKMEILADKGNGNYAYIDNMQEADRYLNKEFKGSMYAIAKDVKIQIEFNPKHVQSYRLIGYENRKLRDEDFANDAIDAGELGSGHTVTALYEIIPVGIKSEYFNAAPELKYSQPTGTANQYNDELATIKFRSKKPNEDKSTEIVKIIPNNPMPLQGTSGDFKFSAAVAWFGLKLRDSKLVPNKKTDDIKALAKQGLQNDTDGYRAEFVRLVEMVK